MLIDVKLTINRMKVRKILEKDFQKTATERYFLFYVWNYINLHLLRICAYKYFDSNRHKLVTCRPSCIRFLIGILRPKQSHANISHSHAMVIMRPKLYFNVYF